jgi:dienelactone hydrolase
MRRRLLMATLVAVILLVGIIVQSGVFLLRGERVTFHNGQDALTGMLVFPRWKKGPFPAVVIVHGSGKVRWQDVRGYARRLAPEGVAVLLYDKRGVGESAGEHRVITVAASAQELGLLAEDAAAAVTFLAHRDQIDPDRIGLIGGSQAGWIMPLAASLSDRVAFLVAISAPAVSYGQEIFYSQLTGEDPRPEGMPDTPLDEAEISRQMQAFNGPHGYDPLPVLQQLRIPSLWLLGGADRSVPTALTVANLERLQEEDSLPLEVDVYPDADHVLRDTLSGKRIDPWPRIFGWLRQNGILRP